MEAIRLLFGIHPGLPRSGCESPRNAATARARTLSPGYGRRVGRQFREGTTAADCLQMKEEIGDRIFVVGPAVPHLVIRQLIDTAIDRIFGELHSLHRGGKE